MNCKRYPRLHRHSSPTQGWLCRHLKVPKLKWIKGEPVPTQPPKERCIAWVCMMHVYWLVGQRRHRHSSPSHYNTQQPIKTSDKQHKQTTTQQQQSLITEQIVRVLSIKSHSPHVTVRPEVCTDGKTVTYSHWNSWMETLPPLYCLLPLLHTISSCFAPTL